MNFSRFRECELWIGVKYLHENFGIQKLLIDEYIYRIIAYGGIIGGKHIVLSRGS